MDKKTRDLILKEIGQALLIGIILVVCSVVAVGQDRMANVGKNSMVYNGIPINQNTDKSPVLNKIISVDMKGVPLLEAVKTIAAKANLEVVYNSKLLEKKNHNSITVGFKKVTVKKALWTALEGTGLRFAIAANKQLILVKRKKDINPSKWTVDANLETITGIVTDAQTEETLPGVNILVKGTSTGASTDQNGQYELTASSLQDTLIFTYIGYQRQEVPINGRTEINVELTAEAIMGDEMVVIGYGQQERENITGSISTIGSEEVAAVPTAGVQQSLQGRAAGVQVTPTTGQPGAPVDIDIRGVSTFGNNNPLYVIDGMPVFVGSGGTENPLASLDPNNIESIEILKDASAAAIYGARAANGVVLVTTKGGQAGDTQVSVSVSGGVNSITEKIGMMNSEQYINYATEAYTNAGSPLPIAFTEPQLSENLSRYTDWEEEAHNSATIQDYSVTISGGNENATYSFSTGYFNQEGTLPNSRFKRYSAKVNTTFDISDNLRVGENIQLTRSNWNGTYDPVFDFYQELLQSSPTMPVRCPENLGGFCGPESRYAPIFRANRIGILSVTDNVEEHNTLRGTAFAEYNFLNSLSYRLQVGGDFSLDRSKNFIPRYEMGGRSNDQAILFEDRLNGDNWLIENTLTYQNVFNGVHDVTALIGYTQQRSKIQTFAGDREEFPDNSLQVLDAGFGTYDIGGNETGWALRSQMARVNYTYDDRYNLMATVRRDGSSRFGENNRYGVFPSFSGNWRMTNESFMQEAEVISNLIIRGSWGIVGSQDIANFASLASIEPGERYVFGAGEALVPGAAYLVQGNPNLKWETTTQTNIGLDIGFFDDKLSFVLDYYVKDTEDILLRVPIPASTGINRDQGAFQNAGSIQNKGFELAINYQNNIGDFNYTVSGNFSSNNNEVTSLGGGGPIFQTEQSDPNYIRTITQVGSEVGLFYGWVMEGIFRDQADVDNHATQETGTAPGDVKFKDLNEDGIIDNNDQTIIGNPFPDFTYGLNFNFLYKNFNLSVQFQGKQGHDIYNLVWAGINEGEGDNNATTEMLDRWTPDNRDTNIPRAIFGDPNQNTRPSTRFVEDGSYLRMRTVKLGYGLPSDMVGKLGISRLQLYVQAENLFTFDNYRSYNPEIGRVSGTTLSQGIDYGAYPIPRSIQAGIQLDI